MTQPYLHSDLQAAWLRLAGELDIGARRAQEAYRRLAERYGEEQRAYHTLDHIAQVLDIVQQLAPLVQNPAQIEMASWLHDVVYDPRATDNEERSAAYAAHLLQRFGQARPFISNVQRLILLTKQHQTSSNDVDGCVLLDADLAVLGAAPETYARYAAAIHHEFAWLPEARYRTGRIAVLQRFLQRPFIYHTESMRQEREQKARENLRREIERLSGNAAQGPPRNEKGPDFDGEARA